MSRLARVRLSDGTILRRKVYVDPAGVPGIRVGTGATLVRPVAGQPWAFEAITAQEMRAAIDAWPDHSFAGSNAAVLALVRQR